MPLQDPVAVYNAANNIEAHQVADALSAAGIEAQVSEEASGGGLALSGAMAENDKSQVWVARVDAERAGGVLTEYEAQARELRDKQAADAPPIEVTCACGQVTRFSAALNGSVQDCPACGEFLDVGIQADSEDWGEPEPEEEPS